MILDKNNFLRLYTGITISDAETCLPLRGVNSRPSNFARITGRESSPYLLILAETTLFFLLMSVLKIVIISSLLSKWLNEESAPPSSTDT